MAKRIAPDLSSVCLKLDRADKHIHHFSDELETFLERDPPPFGFRTEEHPRPERSVEYILYAVVRKPPPTTLALIAGDAIQNMRASLEYLAYELASPRARKAGQKAFPIYSDECEFKVKGVPRIASSRAMRGHLSSGYSRTPLRTFRVTDPLAVLRRLSNLDEHQLLLPMIAALSVSESWVGADDAVVRFRYIERDPLEHDTKIVAFAATPKGPRPHRAPRPRHVVHLRSATADVAEVEAAQTTP